ncbi:MAG: hypothetical protein R3B95_05900 [Nitrospirales bacterium]|nr:hypothetical protein [Nitrospirales bacterium]
MRQPQRVTCPHAQFSCRDWGSRYGAQFHDVISNRDDDVGFHELAVHIVKCLRPNGAERERVGIGNDAVASEHDRVPGLGNDASGLVDLFGCGSAGVEPLYEEWLAIGFHTGDVCGYFDVCGTGLFGMSQFEDLTNDFRNDIGYGQGGVPLGHRVKQGYDVKMLMRFLMQPVLVGLACQGDNWRILGKFALENLYYSTIS